MASHKVPITVSHLCCFYGIQKKSACLIVSAVTGEPAGIPVDRHLQAAFKNLQWVPTEVKDPTEMSHMVELWLPEDATADVNNEIAGIRQLYQKATTRRKLYRVAEKLGYDHVQILKILVRDISVPWHAIGHPREFWEWRQDGSDWRHRQWAD
jgi:hypothetical protein